MDHNGDQPTTTAPTHAALSAVKSWLAELPPAMVAPPLDPTVQLVSDLRSCLNALHILRLQAVDAAEELRAAGQSEELARALAENAAIAQAGGEKELGANEAARKRALTITLESDADYTAVRTRLAGAKYDSDLITAQLQHHLEMYAAVRSAIRLATATAMLNPAVAELLTI